MFPRHAKPIRNVIDPHHYILQNPPYPIRLTSARMPMETLISKYGYLFIALGTILEGEIVLVWGGLWAHLGRLSLPLVMASAYLGTVLGEFGLYLLGRYRGPWLFQHLSFFRQARPQMERFAARYGVWAIFLGRYFYSFRSIGNVFYGLNRMPLGTFAWATLSSCALWTVAVALAGYLFGRAAALVLDEIKRYEYHLLAFIALLFLLAFLLRRHLKKRSEKFADLP